VNRIRRGDVSVSEEKGLICPVGEGLVLLTTAFLLVLTVFFYDPAVARTRPPSKPPPKAVPGLRAPSGWVRGRWKHGWHGGRFGWWWRSQGRWYFYLTPVQPYPPYYGSGPIPIGTLPPGAVVPPVAEGPTPPSLSRWYCVSPPGFYPFVTSCGGGWIQTGTPYVPYIPTPPPVIIVVPHDLS
jgi:hypothetical protein